MPESPEAGPGQDMESEKSENQNEGRVENEEEAHIEAIKVNETINHLRPELDIYDMQIKMETARLDSSSQEVETIVNQKRATVEGAMKSSSESLRENVDKALSQIVKELPNVPEPTSVDILKIEGVHPNTIDMIGFLIDSDNYAHERNTIGLGTPKFTEKGIVIGDKNGKAILLSERGHLFYQPRITDDEKFIREPRPKYKKEDSDRETI